MSKKGLTLSMQQTSPRLSSPVQRDTSRDGLRNRIENYLLTNFRPIWRFINNRPTLARFFNRVIVNNAVLKAPARPLALSTMEPYSSWTSLNDRTWFARYLPPHSAEGLPPIDAVAELFRMPGNGPRLSTRSTLLFPSFAQWFTDGFLMTNAIDRRRTGTSHQIDLGQLYGLTPEATAALRTLSQATGEKGRLKSEMVGREEWAPRLYTEAGEQKPEFISLPQPMKLPNDLPLQKKQTIFAFGGERANATALTAMINIVFLREHNRLCALLEGKYPYWDDTRLFETARNINIVQLIKIVVEEYINHISPYWFRLLGDPTPCYSARWNRMNWIPVEFNLLYRWHSLVPEYVEWKGGNPVSMSDIRFDNTLILCDGLEAGFESATQTKAWGIGLFNTSTALHPVEAASLKQGRDNQLASYNDYRELMKFPRVTAFEQISGDPRVIDGLRNVYGSVDKIEFFAGLFAESVPERSAVPSLIGRMVAVDAFSHALTNPLLSPHVFNNGTFTSEGLREIAATSTLDDLLRRNSRGAGTSRISMELMGQSAFA
jgi:prostaglandin-endoperoxide synthase 2